MLFRTQDNVPEYYVNESRDFQLLCRLKDVMIGGVKYAIDSLRHTANTMEMNASLLPLLKSKLGFFDYDELSEEQLRYLLAGFPDLIKYKGSLIAIEKAIHLWFKISYFDGKLVNIDPDNSNYIIKLYIAGSKADTKLLDTLFRYILPTGYIVEYLFGEDLAESSTYYYKQDIVGITPWEVDNSKLQQVEDTMLDADDEHAWIAKPKDADASDIIKKRLVHKVGFTQIYNPSKEQKKEASMQNKEEENDE